MIRDFALDDSAMFIDKFHQSIFFLSSVNGALIFRGFQFAVNWDITRKYEMKFQ